MTAAFAPLLSSVFCGLCAGSDSAIVLAGAQSDLRHEATASDAVRLDVGFDKKAASAGENVQCQVTAERIGFRGYGMMVAEIGLPPGAEVDRASLENALKRDGWDIDRYEVLPDRVLFYLWPQAGGTKFSFAFQLRHGIKALTAPSVLCDYYNLEARAVVQPVQFRVIDQR